jgi:Erythromycin esterase
VVVAVPVASPEVCAALHEEADEVLCLHTPRAFGAVGAWYADFRQTTDEGVVALLQQARRPPIPGPPDVLHRLTGTAADYDALLERTKRLIAEAAYGVVAGRGRLAGRLPCHQLLRARGERRRARRGPGRRSPLSHLDVAKRRPGRVRGLAARVERLARARIPKAGFYGLDLYSLHTSMEAVVSYLDEANPDAAGRARERYACFDQFGRDPQVYAYEAGIAGAEPCAQQAGELNLGQLVRERYGLEALVVGFTTYTGP